MAYVTSKGHQPTAQNIIEYFPFAQGRYLACAAALNGGNALSSFVAMIQAWNKSLGIEISTDEIWSTICKMQKSESLPNTDLVISPLVLGERHLPEARASVEMIGQGNMGFKSVLAGLFKGIAKNLGSMMPPEVLKEQNIDKIVGVGSCLTRHPWLAEAVKQEFGIQVEISSAGHSCVGSILFVLDHLNGNFTERDSL